MQEITFFSTFTGVGGFELGIQKAIPGAKCVGVSEIDKHSCKVLKKRFPEVKNYGDITTINEKELPDFDILCGGFPCQSFSIAGKRMGFEDTRGTLFFDLARIAKCKRPKILFFENVKGLLSHEEGRTITTIFKTMDELGYDAEWQLLNSKDFGVPQNRERIIIIGHLRGFSTRKVFPITRTNGYDPGKGERQKGLKEITSEKTQWDRVYDSEGVASTLTCKSTKEGMYAVKQSLEEDKKRWGDHYKTPEDISPTLMAIGKTDVTNIIVPTQIGNSEGFGNATKEEEIAFTLRASEPNGIIVHSLQTRSADRPSLKKNPKAGGSGHISKENETYCLDTGSSQAVQVSVPIEQYMEEGNDKPVAIDTYNNTTNSERVQTLTTPHNSMFLGHKTRIRRLTPIECERLQGFPDDWTSKGIEDGKEVLISDNQRYKMMGNAVTTNVIRAVAEKIRLALLHSEEYA